ncbi:MAG: hypothetical protein JW704_03300 [Anaerolineaceae bacterium]|nr:hypothetical protein [Anaerolineaceae bacterium]
MTAIAGMQYPGSKEKVQAMLNTMSHRGNAWQLIIEEKGTILGDGGTRSQKSSAEVLLKEHIAEEMVSSSHYASAKATKKGIELARDPLGVSPLYYGRNKEGVFCFASEVKGLLAVTRDIHELPPGHLLTESNLRPIFKVRRETPRKDEPAKLASELRERIESVIAGTIGDENVGSWLSGGIDSTALAAIARPHVKEFHTFAAGFPGSADIHFAEIAANHIGSTHHTMLVKPEDVLKVLPEVIYHLESFDALLIRSSIMNYLVAKMAADYVPAVFSGEGGDELFAGYEYLHAVPQTKLQDELIDILGRLHNTALQRVDRSAAAHGLTAYVGFLDKRIVDLALLIPVEFKIKDGIEKWILRKSVADLLPDNLLFRKKAKFWQGAGVQDFIAQYADEMISDQDFAREKHIKSGERLNTKEELLYYRIFCDYFGYMGNLSWMGRTKGAPVN